MEIASYKQAAAYINEAYASPAIRKFIFGLEEVSFRDIKGIGSINKVITVEFLLVYLTWLNTDRNTLRTYRSPHYERAAEVMSSLYRTQKFGLDVIIYVLAEGQKDIAEMGEQSFFYPLMDTTERCEFGKIYGLIDDWMNDLQTSEDSVDKILGHFIPVIKMAKALTRASVVTEKGRDGQLKTDFVLDGAPLPSWDIVYIDKSGNRFVLLDIGYEREDALYHYLTIDDLSRDTVIKKANRR
ncbi:MAG: hypothetical protein IJW71_05220 [Clostridia bacterium]|nr:hypothetical protein [Clostridia bacterium]